VQDPLNQYMYLVDLMERNERLFYKLLSENVEELMPIVYTPTVGLACQKFGLAFKRPQVSFFGDLFSILTSTQLCFCCYCLSLFLYFLSAHKLCSTF
jgi:malic enzyme